MYYCLLEEDSGDDTLLKPKAEPARARTASGRKVPAGAVAMFGGTGGGNPLAAALSKRRKSSSEVNKLLKMSLLADASLQYLVRLIKVLTYISWSRERSSGQSQRWSGVCNWYPSCTLSGLSILTYSVWIEFNWISAKAFIFG